MSILPLHITYFFFHYIRTAFLLFTSYFLATLGLIESFFATHRTSKESISIIFLTYFFTKSCDWDIFLNRIKYSKKNRFHLCSEKIVFYMKLNRKIS